MHRWILQREPFVVACIGVALGETISGRTCWTCLSNHIRASHRRKLPNTIMEEHLTLSDKVVRRANLYRNIRRWFTWSSIASPLVASNVPIHVDKNLAHSLNRIGNRFGMTIAELKDHIG